MDGTSTAIKRSRSISIDKDSVHVRNYEGEETLTRKKERNTLVKTVSLM